MAIDSAAVFQSRCIELGLSDHLETFQRLGWRTLSDLVYATTFNPQATTEQSEEKFLVDIVTKGLGARDHVNLPRIKRLFFEAFALCAAELRRQCEASPNDLVRTVSKAEREERRRRVEKRHTSLTAADGRFTDELDVSDNLIDKGIALWDANRLAYIGLEYCTMRKMEIVGCKATPALATVPDAQGYLRMKQTNVEEMADLSTQFEILYAFQRRGLALEMAEVMTFDVHETLRRKLLSSYTKQQPKGFAQMDLDQMMEADQIIWQLLGRATAPGGIRRTAAALLPCEQQLPTILASMDVMQALMPRQHIAQQIVTAPQPKEASPKLLAALQKQIDDLKKQAAGGKGSGGAGSGGGKASNGKGVKKNGNPTRKNDPKPPKALAGMCVRSSTSTGKKKMCFGYNLGQCSAASPGEECAKGFHLCMKPKGNGEACSLPHPANKCS